MQGHGGCSQSELDRWQQHELRRQQGKSTSLGTLMRVLRCDVILEVVGSTTGMVLAPGVVVGPEATPVERAEVAKGCGAACLLQSVDLWRALTYSKFWDCCSKGSIAVFRHFHQCALQLVYRSNVHIS